MKGAVAPHNTRRLAPMMVIGLTLVALIAALAQRPVALLADPGHYVVRVPVAARTWQTEPTDPRWVSPFGIDMYGGISDGQGLAKMRQAGASWVVTTMDWSSVQPTQSGPLDWSHYDQAFADANAAGMDVCVLVLGVPDWADGTGMTGHLAEFVAAAAERYDGDGDANDAPGSPVVEYWSFFGEPDSKDGWGNRGEDYAQMLSLVYPSVKAANPGAVVMNGGIAFSDFVDDPASNLKQFVRGFMDAVIAAGGRQYMDMLAVHFYPTLIGTWAEKVAMLYDTARDQQVGDQMRSLPLISPEMGYWSYPQEASGERDQAVHLVKLFVTGIANGVKRLAWFAVFDGNPAVPTELHGLFRGSDLNQPKLSYWAYRTMTYELNSFSYKGMDHQESGKSPWQYTYEGYVFQRNLDGAQRMVAWANAGTVPVAIKASRVSLVSMLGIASAMQASPVPQIVSDGGPGDADRSANGQVVITLTTDPVYISW